MLDAKDGFVFHTISKEDDGWHTFVRRDSKRGVRIEYESELPLQVQVPVTEEAQAECLASYSTKIGGEKIQGAVGAIGRFSLHDLESLFGRLKGVLADGETLDDPDVIRAKVIAWTPWQGNGKGRAKPTFSRSKLEELSEDEKIALMQKYFTVVD